MSIHKYERLLHKQSGISLVEVLIGMALMLIILGPIVSSLTAGIRSYQFNMAQNQNITSARSSVSSISDELKYASLASISISADANTISYKVGSESRKIYIGSGDNDKTLIIEHSGSINKRVAIKTVQDISFLQDSTYPNKIIITLRFNNNSYTTSPNLDFTKIIVAVENI